MSSLMVRMTATHIPMMGLHFFIFGSILLVMLSIEEMPAGVKFSGRRFSYLQRKLRSMIGKATA